MPASISRRQNLSFFAEEAGLAKDPTSSGSAIAGGDGSASTAVNKLLFFLLSGHAPST
eukprot:TRINITY_DN5321_c0_g1_i1.p2 TRINITY_DN5321_c0_g1~~TRINITY_DN5321_c0_g1_i1.p2  ORF type:complete len:58 (-),score=2.33 TRINITY_DN5321_c0_g1_i1:204-377(-)